MRRIDKKRNIQNLNKRLNEKKNSLSENFSPDEATQREYYNHILQGEAATEEEAYAHARGFDWMEVEKVPMTLPHVQYIDTLNGVDIYFDNGGDYYAFSPAEEEEKMDAAEGLGENKEKEPKVLDETTAMFEKLCGVKLIKEG